MTADLGRRRRPTSSPALLFILSLAGLSQARDRQGRQRASASPAWPSPWSPPSALATPQHLRASASPCSSSPWSIGAAIGLWRAAQGRDDRHARADRDAAQLRRPGRGAGRLERLPVASRRDPAEQTEVAGNLLGIHSAEVVIGVFIGAVTFTGSIVAFLKLSGRIKSNPLMLPAHNALNLGALVAFAVLTVVLRDRPEPARCSIAVTVLALALGWHLVASIGGGDMPVVVSMLNSYSGWAAAASGFLLGNDLLIITGALVGSSGAYLSYIMCKAMNRSFISVIAGGFGNEGSAGTDDRDYGEHTEINAEASPNCSRDADVGGHHPRLRHGRRPGAGRGRRAHPPPARQGRRRPVRHPPGRRPAARAT